MNATESNAIRATARIRVAMGKTVTAVIAPGDLALALTGKSDVPIELKLRNLRIEEVR